MYTWSTPVIVYAELHQVHNGDCRCQPGADLTPVCRSEQLVFSEGTLPRLVHATMSVHTSSLCIIIYMHTED